MALDATLIRAYVNGEVSVGASGASPTLPTDATTALSAIDFTGTGYLTDDGITESLNQDWNDKFAWQNNALVATLPGQFVQTFKFAAMQQSLINMGVHYAGSTITQVVGGLTIAQKAPTRDLRAWVLHLIDGTYLQRIVVPSGQVADRGDVVASSQETTVYEWTLKCFPDSSGNYAYRYFVDPGMGF